MVGVGDSSGHKLPCLIPAVAAFVKQKAHKLGYSECGVGVVYVDSYLFRQVVKRVVAAQVTAQYILNRGGNKEILLAEPEGFTLHMVIFRIEDL